LKRPIKNLKLSVVRLYPNKLKNREFADAKSLKFDSEKTSPLLFIGAVFSELKMGFSAKVKTDFSTCLGIQKKCLNSPKEAP
jgi:hypothetical protein